MSIISTKTHAILDYTVGILLVAAPWMFGFHDGGAAQWIPLINGIAALIISMFTDYEGGFFRTIPMKVHLSIDIVAGVILALSPWLFGFADTVFLPHLIVGVFEIVAGLTTDRVPFQLGKEISVRTAHPPR
jgi:hypothetical protein